MQKDPESKVILMYIILLKSNLSYTDSTLKTVEVEEEGKRKINKRERGGKGKERGNDKEMERGTGRKGRRGEKKGKEGEWGKESTLRQPGRYK